MFLQYLASFYFNQKLKTDHWGRFRYLLTKDLPMTQYSFIGQATKFGLWIFASA